MLNPHDSTIMHTPTVPAFICLRWNSAELSIELLSLKECRQQGLESQAALISLYTYHWRPINDPWLKFVFTFADQIVHMLCAYWAPRTSTTHSSKFGGRSCRGSLWSLPGRSRRTAWKEAPTRGIFEIRVWPRLTALCGALVHFFYTGPLTLSANHCI